MGVNKYRPHVIVPPEEDGNRQLAVEFQAQLDPSRQRQMFVDNVARGWIKVLDLFESVHIAEMNTCPARSMVLLLDFDGHPHLIQQSKNKIPNYWADRVFILGPFGEPEDLKRANLGSYEKIGSDMATDCREGTNATWGHELLQHNAGELDRLREHVRPIFFPV